MPLRTRYQGAIIRDDHLLLIKHREHASGRAYWVIPGGGREEGESEEECVRREMQEETNLDVHVERLLLDDAMRNSPAYHNAKTYLCGVIGGEAKPGYEPEIEASQQYGIVEVRWFDLRHPETWDAMVYADSLTFPLMQRIQDKLGYKA
jgi:ADP-ribose pyrophosphatase YjhB (NUDIX family)